MAALVTAAAVVVPVMAPQAAHAANPPFYNVPPEFPAIDTAVIHEYPTPDPYGFVGEIARGSDGNVWFLELYPNTVVRVTPSGQLTRFPIDFSPTDLVTGPDGNLWVTGADGKVTKMTTSGVITEYPLPPGTYAGGSITFGPGGKLWAIGYSNGPTIVSIDPATIATQVFPLSLAPNVNPNDIAAGPDGNLWFTTNNAGGIGRMTPSGVVTIFPVPGGIQNYVTNGITAGPDGNVWFTDGNDNLVGKITPAGTMTMYPVPLTSSFPYDITAGPDGNLWFTGNQANLIGRITPAGVFTMVHIPTPMTGPYDITTGADGKLWFTEQSQVLNQVASLDPNTLTPPPAPCLTVTKDTTLTHDVGPCAGDGILVTASNVTLNLNGHKVFAAAGQRYGDFAGIHLLGVHGVTVRGGAVTGFDAGVFVDFGSANTIKGMNIHDNISPSDPAVNLGDGILLVHSAGNAIVGSRVVHNGIFDNIANLGLGGNNNRIQGNDVEQSFDPGGNAESNSAAALGIGIINNPYLEFENPGRGGSVTGNQIQGNKVLHNAGPGISTIGDVHGMIRGNTSSYNGFYLDGSGRSGGSGNGIGIQGLAHSTTDTNDQVVGNVTDNNAGNGIDIEALANLIKGNTATGNGFRVVYNGQVYGTFDLFDNNANCGTNIWMGNTYATNSPPCTGSGGQQVASASGAAPAASQPAPNAAANNPARISKLRGRSIR